MADEPSNKLSELREMPARLSLDVFSLSRQRRIAAMLILGSTSCDDCTHSLPRNKEDFWELWGHRREIRKSCTQFHSSRLLAEGLQPSVSSAQLDSFPQFVAHTAMAQHNFVNDRKVTMRLGILPFPQGILDDIWPAFFLLTFLSGPPKTQEHSNTVNEPLWKIKLVSRDFCLSHPLATTKSC